MPKQLLHSDLQHDERFPSQENTSLSDIFNISLHKTNNSGWCKKIIDPTLLKLN